MNTLSRDRKYQVTVFNSNGGLVNSIDISFLFDREVTLPFLSALAHIVHSTGVPLGKRIYDGRYTLDYLLDGSKDILENWYRISITAMEIQK